MRNVRQKLATGLGTLMVAGGLLGASLTLVPTAPEANAQERDQPEQVQSDAHEQMHAMMDMMMGEGASERMHAAMPGSEEMMEACAAGMPNMMNGMDGMMDGGMMNGMDNMMRRGGER